MGFMDKLKEGAKSVAKGALLAAATPYGYVSLMSKTEYKGCKISMDTEHKKLVFIKGVSVFKEHVIAEEVKTFYVTGEKEKQHLHFFNIELTDGTVIDAEIRGEQSSTGASVSLAQMYKNAGMLLAMLALQAKEVSPETKHWCNKILAYADMELLK